MSGTRGHYVDSIVNNANGEPVPGVTVYVYDEYTTTPVAATLYEYDSNHPTLSANTLANPLTSQADGRVEFFMADATRVTLHPVKAGLTFDDRVVDANANVVGPIPADDSITFAKIQNISTDRLIGRDTAGTGDPEQLTLGTGLEFTGSGGIQRSALTGDVTASAGSNATTIANDAVTTAKIINDAVTYAKMQNISAASKLLGRGSAAGSGDAEEITLGTGLSMSGTTLSASATTWTEIRKTSNESVSSSTTLQDDDELFFTAASGTAYEIEAAIVYASPSGGGTPDLKVAFIEDATVRGVVSITYLNQGESATTSVLLTTGGVVAIGTATAKRAFTVRGSHGGGGGTFKFQWAQSASDANATTVYAGSILRYRALT